ncbi:hypothetical protein IWW50_002427 [Coemansia erecta]|nr:hypothetical protein GGF43_002128 [Coemansia sp. RSA 2618]KAJ2826309.1 hypothetical protein IWW50_002427 [Coemansia erecta]
MLDLKNSTYADIRPHKRTLWHRFELWMIHDGKVYTYFGFWVLLEVLLFALALVNYRYYPLWQNMQNLLGGSFVSARAAALALHINTALILLPVCRTVISWIRTTPLNRIIPFDYALLFHKVIGYSIMLFTLIHAASHYRNYYIVSKAMDVPYWRILFTTGHSITGHIMMFVMITMSVTGYAKIRRKHFNVFWNLHHLFVVYFACFSVHGGFCLLKSNLPPYCSTGAAFYKYWVFSGVVYLFERLSREFRANRRANDMRIQKVILHPGDVMEVQFHKPRGFKGLAGQYAFLNCPAVSTQQWHPFTLTSAPEEDYVSMHIRVVGDWTRAFSDALGAKKDHWKALEKSLGETGGDAPKASGSKNVPPPPSRMATSPDTLAGDSMHARDSMAYAPMSRKDGLTQRRNTKTNTMLLVDQSDISGFTPINSAGFAPHSQRSSGLVSRLSQYLTGGTSSRATAFSNGWNTSPTTATPQYHSGLHSQAAGSGGGQTPKMPSLKQLQNYYLREGMAEDRKRRDHGEPVEAYEMTAKVSGGATSASTVVEDTGMRELTAIVNGEKDDEWEHQMPVAGDLSRRLGPEMVAHQSASILPQVLIDGPFGSASEDVFNHEIAMLFCAGIGCTPFASVLKSIWYRMSYPGGAFRLRKVYFFWVQRDTKSFEWFQDLLKAIEEEDDARMDAAHDGSTLSLGTRGESMIEIHTYLTGKLSYAQMTHVHMNVGEVDPITGLRSPTNFGRPNLDLIFRAVAHEHPATDVGVFFCGPHKMGATIEGAAKKWSSEGQDGTKFYYNKENF